jgi:protein involved in polysaccharide export with SLBB domain
MRNAAASEMAINFTDRQMFNLRKLIVAASLAAVLAPLALTSDVRTLRAQSGSAPAAPDSTNLIRVGDKIALWVADQPALSDTFVVHEGFVLRLPNLPDISLAGVHRNAVRSVITKELEKWLKDPRVEASVLLRLAITGMVTKPGYYAVGADIALSDAIMKAGGLAPDASIQRTSVMRGDKVILSEEQVQKALKQGATLASLNVQSGDQITIKEVKRRNFDLPLRIGAFALGVATLYFAARN